MSESGRRKEIDRAAAARRAAARKKKRRKRVAQVWMRRGIAGAVLILLVVGVFFGIRGLVRLFGGEESISPYGLPSYIQEDYLTINPYSRPGIKLPGGVQGIVVHYVGNPGTSAQNNRDYFEGLKDSGDTSASSNFIIGLDGEIIACVPIDEVAYASNSANDYTLSIECCHPDETGQFTDATYESLVRLTAYLCDRFGLDSQDVVHHYDVSPSQKACPLYFVEHTDAWESFRQEVQTATDQLRAETAGSPDGESDGGEETSASSAAAGEGTAEGESESVSEAGGTETGSAAAE